MKRMSAAEGLGLLPIAFFSLLVSFCLLAESPFRLWKEFISEERKVIKNILPMKEDVTDAVVDTSVESSNTSDLVPESFSMMSMIGGSGSGQGSGPAIQGSTGGGISEAALKSSKVERKASVLSRGELAYPLEARRKGISGFVDIRILVGTSGEVQSVQVEKAEPAGVFEKSALTAVRSWKFSPELQQGKVVAGWIRQRIRYDLQTN